MNKKNEAEYEELFSALKERVSSSRYQHSKRVFSAAVELAEIHNADLKKVKKASVLHDIAKALTLEEIKKIIENSSWKIDSLEFSLSSVLHAPAAAEIAKNEFAVDDYDILEAIRYHTLGHPEMGLTAQIIYAADFIEAGRDFNGLNKIRKEVRKDLVKGIYLISSSSIKFQINSDNAVHPYTNDLRNKYLLKRSDN